MIRLLSKLYRTMFAGLDCIYTDEEFHKLFVLVSKIARFRGLKKFNLAYIKTEGNCIALICRRNEEYQTVVCQEFVAESYEDLLKEVKLEWNAIRFGGYKAANDFLFVRYLSDLDVKRYYSQEFI